MDRGFNYLGTIDNKVIDYPWKFGITEKFLNFSLARQVILGRPILLNDGYLILNSVCREQLNDTTSLLYQLIDQRFVNIMSRGGNDYGIHEMPERMHHIGDYNDLIHGKYRGVPDWTELKSKLQKLDDRARKLNLYVSWPAFDMSSGFALLTDELLTTLVAEKTLDLGRSVKPGALILFLNSFIEEVNAEKGDPSKKQSGARDLWERIAKKCADSPDCTNDKISFVNALMRLANELYHYNMGVCLSSTFKCPVSVETQSSGVFDGLVSNPYLFIDDAKILNGTSRLSVPKRIIDVPVRKLLSILDETTLVGKARNTYLDATEQLARLDPHSPPALMGEYLMKDRYSTKCRAASDAADEYAVQLKDLLGEDIKFSGEGLVDLALELGGELGADLTKVGAGAAVSGVMVSAALAAGMPVWATAAVGAAAVVGVGYVVVKGSAKLGGAAIRKFRFFSSEKKFLSSNKIKRNQGFIRRIKAQEIPSALDLNLPIALTYTARMSPKS